MDTARIQQILLTQFGWRVGPNTALYILAQLNRPQAEPFAVIAADARTGLPLRALLDPKTLNLTPTPQP